MNEHLVTPGSAVDLTTIDPGDNNNVSITKDEARQELERLKFRLDELQEKLYAEQKHPVLVIMQGIDTAGKDGTIRAVFGDVNPSGCRVASFRSPTSTELEHDYLWRIHAQLPSKGQIVVFNRSHYEDVLIVRVHNLVQPNIWIKRYHQINEFERMLADEGMTILKFFLYISKDEQKKRLQDRLDDPKKHWKFDPRDLQERQYWSDYIQAYEDMLKKTSTTYAPWYLIPSNVNWYRNLVVARTVVSALERLEPKYPVPNLDLSQYKIE